MAQALGAKFLDENENEVGFGGGELHKIKIIDITGMDPRLKNAVFLAACDVDNPLCGENGASAVFAPQKGASPEDVLTLDSGLKHFAEIIKYQLCADIKNVPGAGAAGGLGAGAIIFLKSRLKKGIEIVARETRLAEKIEGADLVITGEGKIDSQTAFGKTPFGVAQIAKEKNIPVIAIAGSLGNGYQTLLKKGFDEIFSITGESLSLQEAMENAALLLENLAENVVRNWINKNL
jgi:glycerate kinase